MSIALGNPYENYKKSVVNTTPPDKLLIMLYDGAIKFLLQTQKALEKKDFEKANNYNLRVQEIISELNNTLDMDFGEIPRRLKLLYDFYQRQLIEANLRKDPKLLLPVLKFLQDYRSIWEEAARLSKKGKANG